MALATRERNQAQETYERNCDEHDLTMDAIKECVELLEGLKGGSASFVQISKAQRNIKRLAQRLQVSKTWGHLAKVLVNMVQDFASGAAVDKVLGLFSDLKGNLITSRAEMDAANAAQIVAYEAFMAVCAQTIEEAEARIAANEADLEVVNGKIANMEDRRDTAAADRD